MAARTLHNVQLADLTVVFATEMAVAMLDGTRATIEYAREAHGEDAYAEQERAGLSCVLAPPNANDWEDAALVSGNALRAALISLYKQKQHQQQRQQPDGPRRVLKVVLNVAGPRASNDPRVYPWVQRVLQVVR